MKRIITLIILISSLTFVPTLYAGKPKYEIKFATVAPEGSAWMNVMHELDEEVRAKTGGEVGFKIYPGGVQGDEIDVLRKMRYGQLHSAGFTGYGLGEILPEVRILELPFLFNSKEEIDHICKLFYDTFDAAFREKEYVLLGWAEVGYVYIFANKPLKNVHDLKGTRMWTWEGDKLALALFEGLGVKPLPLSLPEVLTGLQTGMLDAVYISPLGAVSLQWFTRVKYMNIQPITNAAGAVLMTKKQFDKIPADKQKILLEISRRYLRELTLKSREDNRLSIEQMEKSGITILDPPNKEEMDAFHKVGMQVKKQLTGKLFSETLLLEIEQALDDFRTQEE
ncbi:MAG: TRAP transporter substrate-binding protein DctP [Candidatus Electryonea clarkiae]|nr:TRAP transporter substrate-binding protein DctP [Candidatus Electryonea clarkiae]MDP8288156.1 TRAP transporter substrate-binding protein DctP [Candidatus Electryonea clarkiae]